MPPTEAQPLTIHGAAWRRLISFRNRIPDAVLEELAQEATLRTLQATDVRSPGAFAGRTGRNLAVDWLRRRREVPLADVREPSSGTGWARRSEASVDASRVRRVLREAPRSYRHTLEALYLEEREIEELVAEEVERRQGPDDEPTRSRARDLVYKRRTRSLGWVRRRLAPASAA